MVLEQLAGGRWTPSQTRWRATLVAVLLLLPLTPAAFYLMTFWKDSWTAITFVWVGAFGLWLFQRCRRMSRPAFYAAFAGFLALMIFAGITRHNAPVALPIMGCMAWLILARRGARFAWLVIGLPALASVLTSAAIDRFFHVADQRPQAYIKMMDLIGICAAFPECREEFPYVAAHLCPGGDQAYRYGDQLSLIDPKTPVVDSEFYFKPWIPDLDAEYRHAIAAHPWELLYVKWESFCLLFDPGAVPLGYCYKGIDPNAFGLRQNEAFQMFRYDMHLILDATWRKPVLNVLGSHSVWFAVDFIACVGLLIRLRRQRTATLAFWLLLMAIPLSYSCSYLAATTGFDYRFLYPSTLFTQVVALSLCSFMERNISRKERRKVSQLAGRRLLPLAVAALAALAVWIIFSPGNMSFDSFDQYRQAFAYDYHDWHPPIMSIILSIVMFYGGGVGALMLMQCVAGVLGILRWQCGFSSSSPKAGGRPCERGGWPRWSRSSCSCRSRRRLFT